MVILLFGDTLGIQLKIILVIGGIFLFPGDMTISLVKRFHDTVENLGKNRDIHLK